jgi:hypothetical protein
MLANPDSSVKDRFSIFELDQNGNKGQYGRQYHKAG